MTGAPTIGSEKLPNGLEGVYAIRKLEEFANVKADALIAGMQRHRPSVFISVPKKWLEKSPPLAEPVAPRRPRSCASLVVTAAAD